MNVSGHAVLILAAGALFAGVNGANDVSRGIATLVGSGVTGYRRAILWGAAWTAVGGLAAFAFAGAMASTFGNGLLAPGTTPTVAAALATLLGAAGWVLLATRTGLPVSTTHAIVGSLAGVAAFAYGVDGVRWSVLAGKIVLPLILSPVASLALTVLLVRAGRLLAGPSATGADCLCVEPEPAMAVLAAGPGTARSAVWVPGGPAVRTITGTTDACAIEHPAALRLSLDHLHWLTSGATSLARGMNDAPKMAALILVAAALATGAPVAPSLVFVLVTLGMVAGSVVAGVRVTRVLAENITVMDHREGFLANVVTAALVTAGAVGGLPMSTTHVSASAIIGTGAQRGSRALNRKTVRDLLLAWLVTLPAAAALGTVTYVTVRAIQG